MIYTVIALALVGGVVLALSRRTVAARPVCPNCREPLESFEVDRCPYCLLWQPPDRDVPTVCWRKRQAILGGLLIGVPAVLYLLLPIVVEAIFAPPSNPTPTVVPGGWGATPPLPPALQALSPSDIAKLRAMGYLPGQWGQPAQVQPGRRRPRLSELPPHVIKALRSAGYLPSDYVEPAPKEDGDDDDAGAETDNSPDDRNDG